MLRHLGRTDLVNLNVSSSSGQVQGHNVDRHSEIEIYYFIQGDVERRVGDQQYRLSPESLVLIPSDCFHTDHILSAHLYQRMSIHFVPGLLDKKEWDAFAEILNTPIYIKTYCSPSSGIIGSLFRSLALCRCMEKPLQFVALKHGVIFLLSHICSIYRRNRNNPQEVSGRIESVLNYLDCNLSRPLSLEDVSREFNITPNHLNRVFREATKIPLHRYLQNRRLQLAKTKIENGYTAEEAAFQSGFNDYSSFFRAYKRCYGTAPSGVVRNRGDATTWGADGEKPDGTTGGDTSSATRHC